MPDKTEARENDSPKITRTNFFSRFHSTEIYFSCITKDCEIFYLIGKFSANLTVT